MDGWRKRGEIREKGGKRKKREKGREGRQPSSLALRAGSDSGD